MAEATHDKLLRRWDALATALGWGDGGRAAGDDLLYSYGDSRRAYHNLQHLLECLEELDAERPLAGDAIAVELALWFHDAVYDATRTDNEAASAELAADWLGPLGETSDRIGRVQELILDTAHRQEPTAPDGRLIVDIDLSILGKPAARFDAYDAAIAAEYAHVPADAYRTGRAAVLRGFLARPTIYRLPAFIDKYERQARRNIARAISRLERGGIADAL